MCPWPNQRTIDDFPLSKNSPPTFIASARDDKTAPISFAVAIDEKLKAGRRGTAVRRGQRRPRRIPLWRGRRARRQVARRAAAWLKQIDLWQEVR